MKGTYTLVMVSEKPANVRIGKVGQAQIGNNLCLYTGSALGHGGTSLEKRVSRHYKKDKPTRWHVDYLTVRPEITIKKVICLTSPKRFECQINQLIISELDAKPILLHAGSTDCKCAGHLVALRNAGNLNAILKRLEEIYSRFGDPFQL